MLARRHGVAALAAIVIVGSAGAGTAARIREPRPFDHRRHESVSCRSCHGAGERHRDHFIRSARDCAACHHDASRAQTCSSCHSSQQIASVNGVVAALSLSVWDSARPRVLPFAHVMHKNVQCRQCHATPVTLQRSRECSSCHQQHHRADANCAACHNTPPNAAHPKETHLTCGAAQCHASQLAPVPTLSRNVCVVCHTAQRTHEVGGTCASCHKIPDPETAAAALRGAQ